MLVICIPYNLKTTTCTTLISSFCLDNCYAIRDGILSFIILFLLSLRIFVFAAGEVISMIMYIMASYLH
jgi:hypothetical protein